MKFCLAFALSTWFLFAFGQTETYYVRPVDMDSGYSSEEDSSTIKRNSDFQANRLFLFFGGTGTNSATTYKVLGNHAAKEGFDFINLSYPNNVAAYSLSNNPDSLAYNKYREEINFGTPVSEAVSVDSFHSIYTRVLKTIHYLDTTHSLENWGQYLLNQNELDWSKIILGGHSQGAGHAAYLAKHFSVDRVLLFSGPNDYSNFYSNSANWLRASGITPHSRHFAYLSLNDEVVDFSKQFTNLNGLMIGDSIHVDNINPPYENMRFLYTTQDPGIFSDHSMPILWSQINLDVWTYLLNSDISTAIERTLKLNNVRFHPNPTSDFLYVKAPENINDLEVRLFDLEGRLVQTEYGNDLKMSLGNLTNGMYILQTQNRSYLVIKQD